MASTLCPPLHPMPPPGAADPSAGGPLCSSDLCACPAADMPMTKENTENMIHLAAFIMFLFTQLRSLANVMVPTALAFLTVIVVAAVTMYQVGGRRGIPWAAPQEVKP